MVIFHCPLRIHLFVSICFFLYFLLLLSAHKWDFVIRAGSRRSLGCDQNQTMSAGVDGEDSECVCLGTENGRNTISVERGMGHYERLWKSYEGCRRIVRNLELTHVEQEQIQKEPEEAQKKGAKKEGTNARGHGTGRRPFHFLENLEEITGYLLIFNINTTEISLPRLRVIWGERLNEGNALQIDTNPGLEVLNMPSLRTIENGNVTIKRTPNLCYMDPTRNYVRYKEILGTGYQKRLHWTDDGFSSTCARARPCHAECPAGNCFGKEADQCQIVYRKMCPQCESGCFLDKKDDVHKCCDDACTGGCTGDGADKCIACKKFEQDGRCVSECRGVDSYNPVEKRMEPLPEKERRYSYGSHCVPECPAGSLFEGAHCVSRCSAGKYRNDTDHCVPCPGQCPKVCQLDEPINSVNIRQLVNCTEIEGNIEILSHVFDEHLPMPATFNEQTSETILIHPLNATQLEMLRSVRVITGFLLVDGGRKRNKRKPTTLDFLSNLEVIEGRTLYYEKYSLYVIGNVDLKRLGLRSLKRIKNGMVSITENRQLCYSYTIPFKEHFGVRDSKWKGNMNESQCEASNRVCSQYCESRLGCWGKDNRDCVQCRKFSMENNVCTDHCQTTKGQYIVQPPTDSESGIGQLPRRCLQCHEQCLECYGDSSRQCTKCRNFELWRRSQSAQSAEFAPFVTANTPNAVRECVATCPNLTFPQGSRCEPCHPACRSGCTGASARVGLDGCNQCQYALEGERIGELICLAGDEPEKAVCGQKNGLGRNYFITLAAPSSSSITKYLCRKCRPECSTCMGDGVQIREQSVCQCTFYQMAPYDRDPSDPTECAMECAKGSRVVVPRKESDSGPGGFLQLGLCQQCHPLCDPHFSCSGPGPTECDRCSVGGIVESDNNGTVRCLSECPPDAPFPHEGICYEQDIEHQRRQRTQRYIAMAVVVFLIFASIISFLVCRCLSYQKKYVKEVQMHLPEIPPLDPMKVTQRPNMRRINLIQIDELEFAPEKRAVLGQGAFGIVYVGKWKPPNFNQYIPVAIKAINCSESRYINEKEMLHEAGLMHTVRHEHLLPVAGICMGGDGLKIVTLLRPLGSLLKFLQDNGKHLGSKHLMLYCYQISSAMEYLAKKKIVHRDLAARNVLVRNVTHVEVTDFGLAAMLQQPGDSVVVDGRVAIKWLALESLRRQLYNQKTDVWSFGITCWEILTFGESPYKELLTKREKMASELAYELERGYRLRQPANCSQELYQELLNCWLVDPDSRPNFGQIKGRFEQFCRAPHIYIQDRQATQRLNSLAATDQRAMIERLLRDNDFLDPVNLDPAEYMHSQRHSGTSPRAAGAGTPQPNTLSTDCFFSASPTPMDTSTMTRNGEGAKRSGGRPGCRENTCRLGSTGTASTRYKADPVGRKHSHWSQSTSEAESPRAEDTVIDEEEDEEEDEWEEEDPGKDGEEEVNYLVPKRTRKGAEGRNGRKNRKREEDEEEDGQDSGSRTFAEMYTPVVEGEKMAEYTNSGEPARNEYANDGREAGDRGRREYSNVVGDRERMMMRGEPGRRSRDREDQQDGAVTRGGEEAKVASRESAI